MHVCERLEVHYDDCEREGNVLHIYHGRVDAWWLIVQNEEEIPSVEELEKSYYAAVVLENQKRRHPILMIRTGVSGKTWRKE